MNTWIVVNRLCLMKGEKMYLKQIDHGDPQWTNDWAEASRWSSGEAVVLELHRQGLGPHQVFITTVSGSVPDSVMAKYKEESFTVRVHRDSSQTVVEE